MTKPNEALEGQAVVIHARGISYPAETFGMPGMVQLADDDCVIVRSYLWHGCTLFAGEFTKMAGPYCVLETGQVWEFAQ